MQDPETPLTSERGSENMDTRAFEQKDRLYKFKERRSDEGKPRRGSRNLRERAVEGDRTGRHSVAFSKC